MVMRILQLTPRVPTPMTDGGRIAMRNLAAGLRQAGARVVTLSLNPRKHRVEPSEAGCSTVEIDTGNHVTAVFRGLVTGVPPNVARFRSREFSRRFAEMAGDADVVQLEELAMAPYIGLARRISAATVVLRPLNVESEVWDRMAAAGSAGTRLARRLLAAWLRTYERRVVARCDAIVPVTSRDATALARHTAASVHVAPVGLDLSLYPFLPPESADLGFLGALDYTPNVDGLDWLLRDVWPLLRETGMRLRVAGSGAAESMATRVRDAGAEYAGLVPDARAFLAGHGVVLVPLLSGGGMRVKIIEAMALGCAVVTTTVGAEGLGVVDGAEVRVADEAGAFSAAVAELVGDRARRVAMGERARRFVERKFDATVIGRELLDFYETLVPARAGTATHGIRGA